MPFIAIAQSTTTKVIGYLTPAAKPGLRDEVFLRELNALGWHVGKNIRIEYRRGGNTTDQMSQFAKELVGLNVDLIVAQSTPAVEAAKNATKTIPIVMLSADPIGNRFVTNLAKPTGNITGISMMMPELAGKRLEVLKQMLPKLNRIAFLAYPGDPAHVIFVKEAQRAGTQLGIEVVPMLARTPKDIDDAFATMKKEKVEAVMVQPLFINTIGHTSQIVKVAQTYRVAAISDGDAFADAGGLMFYGPDSSAIYRRVVGYVDRILKGSKPGDLPVEQPDKFQLVINLKTAQALGIQVPESVLVRADRVIR